MRQFLTDGLTWVGGNAVKFIAIIVMMLSLDWHGASKKWLKDVL